MPQRTKTRVEIAHAAYLSTSDIRKLYGIGWTKAKKIFDFANKIDDQELGEWRIEDTKVRMESVLKVTRKSLDAVMKMAAYEKNAS